MADTTVGISVDPKTDSSKIVLDYHIDADTDIAVSDDTEGNKTITFTKKF
jgi:hypothetical protein